MESGIDVGSISLITGSLCAVMLTLAWLAVHAWGAFRLLKLKDQSASKKAMAAWGLSFVGGFMGPCVFFTSVIAFFLAMGERRKAKWGDASEATGVAAGTAMFSSVIIMVMVGVLLVAVLAADLSGG